jgi:predicted nucleic acid-binding protein
MEEILRPSPLLAGKAFRRYRARRRTRNGVTDFFIGAHAAVLEISLPTRDVGRVRACFLTVGTIAD